MSDIDPELYRLQDLLDTIPSDWKGMNVVELDGYVAGLIVCPDTVPPAEWLPGVWGSNVGFEDAEGTEPTIAAVMAHYDRIARKLAERPEDYAPVLGVDADSGEELWEPWVGGFERAMRLRRAVWRRIARGDDREASASLNMMIALSNSCRGRADLTDEGEEELRGLAPELIPELVCKLHAWRKSREAANATPDRHRGSQDTGDQDKLLPHRNTEGDTWDADAMIHNARSLQAVAQHLVFVTDPGRDPDIGCRWLVWHGPVLCRPRFARPCDRDRAEGLAVPGNERAAPPHARPDRALRRAEREYATSAGGTLPE